MEQTTNWFTTLLEQKGLAVNAAQLAQFERYFELLVEWNEKMNLTGITEKDAVYEKHFFDSIALAFYMDLTKAGSLADIGSGAGFPSIPLKIMFPHLQITIVDSLNKRISFLKHLAEQLNLNDVQCVHGRAEDIARLPEHRDHYDVVTARAVARLNVLNEFCLPFVRQGGMFAAMKGAKSEEEVQEAGASFRALKGKMIGQHELKLPFEQSERHIILVSKMERTPRQYPRKAGTPLKQPIV